MKKFVIKLATISMVSFFSISASYHTTHAMSPGDPHADLIEKGNQKVNPACQQLAQKWLKTVEDDKEELLKDPEFRPSQLFLKFVDEIHSANPSIGKEPLMGQDYHFEKYPERHFKEWAASASPEEFFKNRYDWAHGELKKVANYLSYLPISVAFVKQTREQYPSDEAYLHGYVQSIYSFLNYTERLFDIASENKRG
ncbi:MAG: hypothetical protein B7Y25_06960 [Alphaproteobacteria bacterium 16-39-46]|nr:MAG: hypothetical protein B7Y25_06960 [Alphaproteobacteria bacterium 16-39-46]OZA42152.1 MAG: hypothetical protein B7X84_06900 [Alphaproteobacteria bacterium 17-39-52]HQS84624.1 hypothetical protein [Alphaproteobacteria bacterium]HQS94436.1 hypothetical protein [Alphaproteobacteria bacterium]